MSAYYNEFDPSAAAWLRELIKMGLIAPGDVDERSITDVHPDDLRGYAQCHFFAGIGGWSYAARLAGWPDDRPLWTGSCPCQPFSVAGKGAGVDDPRHLWPHFFRLIRACRPLVVMGEQVAGKAGYGWLDGVRADLAGEDYACRGVDIPACAVDAPHIRSRLYWIAVGNTNSARADFNAALCGPRGAVGEPDGRLGAERAGSVLVADARSEPRQQVGRSAPCDEAPDGRARRDRVEPDSDHRHRRDDEGRGCVAHPGRSGLGGRAGEPARHDGDGTAARRQEGADRVAGGDEGDLANADGLRSQKDGSERTRVHARGFPASRLNEPDAQGDAYGPRLEVGPRERSDAGAERSPLERAGARNGTFWSDAEWIACHDGKARRAGSSLSVLVDGLPVDLADRREQCRQEATKAILSYAESRNTDAAETVSLVRSKYDPQEIRDRLGVPGELPTPEVLFTFLLGLTSALPSAKEQSDVAPTRDENSGFEMRGLRDDGEPVRPPYQRRSDGQPAREQTDTLLELSLVLARCADQSRAAGEMAYASPIPLLSQGVTHRVAKWRGFGNAIVPQVAAEVIAAFLDVEHILPIEDLI